MRQPWFQLKSDEGEDFAPVLLGFAEMIGLERVASGRYSLLLLLELFASSQSRQLNPAKVVHEIEGLESVRGQSITKGEAPLKHPPLKGLWHKHYLADGLSSMAQNIRNELDRSGIPWLDEQIAESEASGVERFLTEQDCAMIAHDIVVGSWERRTKRSAVTGEWLIYAKHEDQNYYLSLCQHKGDHEALRAQIDAICAREFPFLGQILT